MRKRKILSVISVFLLFAFSLGMLVWYYKKVEEAKIEVEQARKAAQKPVPKEIEIKVFFGNKTMNSSLGDCKKVFPVVRVIPNDLIIRRRAIEELFLGPRPNEVEQGYYSNTPSKEEIIEFREKVKKDTGQAPYEGDEVKIKSFKIYLGMAHIVFSREFLAYGGDPCRLEGIKSQINETMKQFPKVSGALIFIEGNQNAL